MKGSILLKKIEAILRRYAHWRCRENIVLFESDDWGLLRKNQSENLKKYGEPKIWAEEESETVEDLEQINNLLESFRDQNSRPCCFTAYFIVANPDFNKISESGFKQYFDTSIEYLHELKSAWLACYNNKTFFPQYHGRFHQNWTKWLDDLQDNSNHARIFFENENAPGISLNKGSGEYYKSEYYDYQKSPTSTIPHLNSWIKTGLQYFKNTFGYHASITVAPHYIYNSSVAETWKFSGLKYIQGNNYHLLVSKNQKDIIISRALGEKNRQGTLLLGRNINFEPASGISSRNSAQCVKQIKNLFRLNIPAIVDTHRINYTGRFKNDGLKQLKTLVSQCNDEKPLFLTSLELGQAIENNGVYRDSWTGKEKRLTPCNSILQKITRQLLAKLNNSRIEKYNSCFTS